MVMPITGGSINLTQACNLACPWCFSYGHSSKRMNFETGKKIIDFLFMQAEKTEQKYINLSFWGGEPLLEWELLKKIAIYIKNRKNGEVKIGLGGTTNGTLLTEERFNFLDEYKIFFMISLDGTRETHDVYRVYKNGNGTHKIVVRNAEKALKRWPFYRARMSLCPGSIGRFYEDMKFLIDLGFRHIMFSPVYELEWKEEDWRRWEDECERVIDLLADYKKKKTDVKVEHFNSYVGADHSHWPCGAARFYVGFDVDGAIYPCHRFIKMGDMRPWWEKPMVIGHVDYGITDAKLRSRFINFIPASGCQGKDCFKNTPCHGGCYAINYDMTGSIQMTTPKLCRYVESQVKVSKIYKDKIGISSGVPQEKKPCICYFEHYCGPV